MPRQLQIFKCKNKAIVVSIAIILLLSAFTHIWNPIGFPAFHVDEGHYMRRAMQVINGLGPQESKETYEYGYDHPFFGQIFLAASLTLVNFPDSLDPSVNLHSVEMLYLVPRMLMGILAVFDTFLVYKIAETRYNRKVGFISATLFAVMPLSRILRGILLDSIELPLVLLSILFAVYYAKYQNQSGDTNSNDRKLILILISGIFFGLAVFTKVPVFSLIPLLAYIILKSNKEGFTWRIAKGSGLKIFSLWFIPVILLPLMWPAYALSVGQFGDWLDGVIYQTERQGGRGLGHSLLLISQMDPFLVTLGLAGIIYCSIKRDYLIILWTAPYVIFLYLIGWVVYFHWSVLIPMLCIASAILVEDLRKRVVAHKVISVLPYFVITAIAIFGFYNMVLLAKSDLNATYNEVYLFVIRELEQNQESIHLQSDDHDYGTTMIGSHRTRALLWIPKYVFGYDVVFRDTDLQNDNFTKLLQTERFLLVADANLLVRLTEPEAVQHEKYNRITRLYYNSSETIATFIDREIKKNDILNIRENHAFGPFVEVRTNH